MEACEVFRIPHSHYLGGPLQWTDLDREKAEAHRAWKALACPDCGTRGSDWDPKQGGHRHMFIGDIERCLGCEVLEQTRAQVGDDDKGMKVFLRRNLEVLEQLLEKAAA